MTGLTFDEQTSQRILRTYTTQDVVEQRRQVRAALRLQPGEDVLDIGSGPGLLAGEMAAEVGPDGRVVGLEPSPEMRAIAGTAGPATFVDGAATSLPFDDASFDAAVSTQVYEYVSDIAGALAEARRVLRPNGRLLILDTDWDSIVWHCRDQARMRRVLGAWDEHLADPYLPRRLPHLLKEAGFRVERASALPLLNIEYRPDTYSAGLIGFITAFAPGHQGLSAEELTEWADELRSLGAEYFFSLNRYLFLATR